MFEAQNILVPRLFIASLLLLVFTDTKYISNGKHVNNLILCLSQILAIVTEHWATAVGCMWFCNGNTEWWFTSCYVCSFADLSFDLDVHKCTILYLRHNITYLKNWYSNKCNISSVFLTTIRVVASYRTIKIFYFHRNTKLNIYLCI